MMAAGSPPTKTVVLPGSEVKGTVGEGGRRAAASGKPEKVVWWEPAEGGPKELAMLPARWRSSGMKRLS